jgi:hypothetical protein
VPFRDDADLNALPFDASAARAVAIFAEHAIFAERREE